MHYDLRRLKKLLLARYSGPMLEAFEQRQRTLITRLRKARKKPSEKAVHDLRVAVRRMLSMLVLLETVLPARDARKTRRDLRKLMGKLGPLRDLQTQILQSDELLGGFPQLTAFRKHLMKEERRQIRRVEQALEKFSPAEFGKTTDALLSQLIATLQPGADRALGGRIVASMEDTYRRVLALRDRTNPKNTATIHKMRIAFKKFRYMAEITAPYFPRLNRERLAEMHDYQDRMGAIQDVETLLGTMVLFRKKSGLTSILVVENELRRRRQRLIDEFMRTVDEIRFFWSTAQVESREVV